MIENLTKEQYDRIKRAKNLLCSYCETEICKAFPESCMVMDIMTKLESQAKESSIVRTYEVAFVVFGYVQNKDDDIGCIECNGLTKAGENYVLKDGRIYCNVVHKSPQAAYEHGVWLMQSGGVNLGNAEIVDWYLEHVSCEDEYWYKEDLEG